jgi:hypothetical protein
MWRTTDKSFKFLVPLSSNWSVKIYLDTKFNVNVLSCVLKSKLFFEKPLTSSDGKFIQH